MPFSIIGRRRGGSRQGPSTETSAPAPLTTVSVVGPSPRTVRSLGRREAEFGFDRLFIPSLVIDHTELALRQAGVNADEGFALWAGSLAAGDAYTSTLVLPRASTGPTHGVISEQTTAGVLNALDERDLVPIAQVHTHPHEAWLSKTDAIRPLVAVNGFISIIVPDYGFVDLSDVRLWSAHEYLGARRWRELDSVERHRRLIIDDSIIRVA